MEIDGALWFSTMDGAHIPGVLVIGRESCGMGRLGDGAWGRDFLKCVDAFAGTIEGEHEMHGGQCSELRAHKAGARKWIQ